MRKIARLCVVLGVAAGLSGCASIKHGTYEKVSIVSNPSGAWCKLYRDGEGYIKSISTPGEKYVKRSSEPLRIVCTKDGYEELTLVHSPAVNHDNAGNISNVGSGLVVDGINAGNYDLPEVFEIRLEKQ